MQVLSFVLIERAKKYLLIKEASLKYRGKWFFPGGKVDKGERPEKAVVRETREEAGCKVNVKGFFFCKYNDKMFPKKLHVYYIGRTKSATLKDHPDKNSLDAHWFSYKEIKKLPLRDNALAILDLYRRSPILLPVKNFIIQR